MQARAKPFPTTFCTMVLTYCRSTIINRPEMCLIYKKTILKMCRCNTDSVKQNTMFCYHTLNQWEKCSCDYRNGCQINTCKAWLMLTFLHMNIHLCPPVHGRIWQCKSVNMSNETVVYPGFPSLVGHWGSQGGCAGKLWWSAAGRTDFQLTSAQRSQQEISCGWS